MLKQFASIILLLIGCTPALALEEIKIEGMGLLDEEACAKSGNCNLTFKIGGKLAKTIYEGMGTVARTNDDTGGFDKTDRSGMSCHLEDERYSCNFIYDFRLQEFSLALTVTPTGVDAFKIDGGAFLDEEACAKGLNAEGCILSFQISDKVAKTLYEGMTAEAVQQECTGGLQKVEGGLNCIKDSETDYYCDFGYNFKEGSFGGSGVDC